jgi:YVTN family beta-propeller protein
MRISTVSHFVFPLYISNAFNPSDFKFIHMRICSKYSFSLWFFLTFVCLNSSAQQMRISAPAGDRYTQINKTGETVLPNGRLITPEGRCFTVAPHPYGLAVSRDGNIAVTANSGIAPLSITILRNLNSGTPDIQQVPPGPSTDKGILASVFMGLAISPDQKLVYVSGGQENRIYIFRISDGAKMGFIDCRFRDREFDYTHGYIGDMVLSSDGSRLYAVDQVGFRMLVIDTREQKLLYNVPVGRYPFGIALSPDENQVYVANVGMYVYSLVKKKRKGEWKNSVIDYPAFAYGSAEAEKGIQNDTLSIPGLGSQNPDEAFSVWAIDLKSAGAPQVTARIKTGIRVGQMVEGIPAVGGSSPNSIVASGKYVFISNGTNDRITVLDAVSNRFVTNIRLSPDPRVERWRGVIPFGLDISPDGRRVYVAESGINAIAVIDAEKLSVLGHIPAGWFPARLRVSPDGKKLIVANAKGYGSGPNGGSTFTPGPEGSYIGSLMKGNVQILDIPADLELGALTARVVANNFRFSESSGSPGEALPPIRHIVFISKENRTYDEVMGQLKSGDGEEALARFGNGVSFSNHNKTRQVDHAGVMPNHLKLAAEFSVSDNFYVDSDVSADGHRWLVNTYPNEWVEATTPANYGDNRNYNEESGAPGSLGMNGYSGAIYPEDYNEAGSLWDHLARHGIPYFNFGFGMMFEPADYQDSYKYGGIKQVANFPLPASLYDRSSRVYPTYNTAIPDQFRVDMFKKEFEEKWGPGKDSLPALLTVILPNDHGAGERPEAGYPFRESYMADNDLALGRIVEYLSYTPYWKSMMIVVTEDDAQNGVDHVDAHRSLLMVISPYARRNFVSHTHYSFGSIFKTFWDMLGLPYLNQYDAGASGLNGMFTPEPDFTPYTALPADPRVFDAQKALDPLDEKFDWKQARKGPAIDDPEDMIRESKEQDQWRLENREKQK